jgi:GH15 family glucan-1,4-alpha-glucosidase
VPRFDSPSVFGTLLDREAGYFRFAPFGVDVPSARFYEPGTNTLTTTWQAKQGWVLIRDALTMGPRRAEDTVTPHTRPPTDDDADHMLVRTALCLEGEVEIELVCEPAVATRPSGPCSTAAATRPTRAVRGRRSG